MTEEIHRYSLNAGYNLHWYEIKSVLGRGGNGITYLAHDRNLDRSVAIKEYLPIDCALRDQKDSVRPLMESCANLYYIGLSRFLKEGRTLAKFVHPNIVRVHSIFEENNTAYMVMEYEQGKDLGKYYKNNATICEQTLINIFLPVLEGLQLVHQAGFIHRDIKPANIYLRNDSSPVLLDFGSARQTSSDLTRTLTVLATYGYAPFEQYDQCQETQGPWSDIYALGASIYFGVTGDKPVDSLKRAGAIIGGSKDLYIPLSAQPRAGYSENFLLAVDNALMFHPKDRPQDIPIWSDMLRGNTPPPPLPENLVRHPVADLLKRKSKSKSSERPKELPTESGFHPTPKSLSRDDLTPIAKHTKDGDIVRPTHENHKQEVTESHIHEEVVRSLGAEEPDLPAHDNRWRVTRLTVSIALMVAVTSISILALFHNSEYAPPIATNPAVEPVNPHIQALLDQAQSAFSAGQYLLPETSNAMQLYKSVLAMEPGNQAAKEGMESIVEHFSQQIQESIDKGDLNYAETLLQQTENNTLKTTVFLQLRLVLRKAKQNQTQLVGELVRNGQAALEAGRFAEPENDNALRYFQQALQLDANNQKAQAGLRQIHDHYIDQASHLATAGQIDKAKTALDVLQTAMPDSEQVNALRQNVLVWERKNAEISDLLQQAEADKNSGRYVEPGRNNALYRYQQVLKLDHNNATAQQEIERMLAQFNSQYRTHAANNDIDKAQKAAAAIVLISPNSALSKKVNVELASVKRQQKPDLEMINDLIRDFKTSFESYNMIKLYNLSEFAPGRQKFLEQFFDQYRFFNMEISDFAYITIEQRASAVVSLNNLVNKEGEVVNPGSWNQFQIQIAKNDEGHWKVYW